jgi:hypothetical protein
MLNIAEETQMPGDLSLRVQRMCSEMDHPLGTRAAEDFQIAESMDALYELQDRLMLTLEGVEDEED